jgi:hypothetical protein
VARLEDVTASGVRVGLLQLEVQRCGVNMLLCVRVLTILPHFKANF